MISFSPSKLKYSLIESRRFRLPKQRERRDLRL